MLCVPVRFLSQACSPFFHSVFYLSFQAALALNCGTRNLESVAPSFVTQALQSRLSSCSMQALLPMWHLCSPVRDRTCCSCTRRQILNPWAPGKPPPPKQRPPLWQPCPNEALPHFWKYPVFNQLCVFTSHSHFNLLHSGFCLHYSTETFLGQASKGLLKRP